MLASDRSRSAWRLWVGSAGLVLCSQEGSGEDGAFALCARDLGDRLRCSLRTAPAPLGVLGAPRDRSFARRKARGRMELSRFARGFRRSPSMLASDRSRSAWRLWVGSAGLVLGSPGALGQMVLWACPDFALARNSSARAAYPNLHETFRSTSDLQYHFGFGERLDSQRLQAGRNARCGCGQGGRRHVFSGGGGGGSLAARG